jgi:hypothetical protein
MFTFLADYGDKLAAALVALLGLLGSRFLWGRLAAGTARLVVQRAYAEVVDAVLEVWQTYVSDLRKSRADGVLTAEERATAKARALAVARQNLGAKGLTRLARALGFGSLLGIDNDATTAWLGTKVETAVASLKSAGLMTGATRPAPIAATGIATSPLTAGAANPS